MCAGPGCPRPAERADDGAPPLCYDMRQTGGKDKTREGGSRVEKDVRTEQRDDPRSLARLVASMLIFGSIGLFRRLIPLSSALVAFFRGVIGCAVLLPGARAFRAERPDRRTTALLLFTGAAIGVNWMLLFEAYRYTTVQVATLCYYMEPTFVILLSWLLGRERMTWTKAACALLALAGMALVSGAAEGGLGSAGDPRGILFGLGAGLIYAVVVLCNKSIRGVDVRYRTILQLGAAAAAMVPYLLLGGASDGGEWSRRTLLLVLAVGTVHTGLAYALYFGSMDGLRTQTVALFSYVDPVAALLLSAAFLGERLTVPGLVGAGLILGAAVWCERKGT